MDTVKAFGVVNDGKGLDYYITTEDGNAIQRLPAEFQNGYVAFVIGAKHNTKKLPENKIISICEKIHLPIVLLGDKEDSAAAERIVAGVTSRQVFNACGKFSLNESAALVKLAAKVISHDTGLMHIAAAFKKQISSVWGNTVPEFGMYPYYGDFDIRNTKFEIALPCRPCTKIGFEKCPRGHFKCMLLQDDNAIAGSVN